MVEIPHLLDVLSVEYAIQPLANPAFHLAQHAELYQLLLDETSTPNLGMLVILLLKSYIKSYLITFLQN
jgi:hypothetical protein